MRERDEQDFDQLLPLLDLRRRDWLSVALAETTPNHPWLARLSVQ
jgi:hypothetical protein